MGTKTCGARSHLKQDSMCFREPDGESKYCQFHKYFEEFTDADVEKINNFDAGDANEANEFKVCKRCKHWHNNKSAMCVKCLAISSERKKEIVARTVTKCSGKDRNGDPCRNSVVNETKFCKYHDYMTQYDDMMMENLTFCAGCRKYYYKPNQGQCEKCRDIGKKNREKSREEVIKCKHEGCKFKAFQDEDGNMVYDGYCQPHKIDVWKNKVEASMKRICKGFLKGCRAELDMDYEFAKCEQCRECERIYDKSQREKKAIIARMKKYTDTPFCPECSTEKPAASFNDKTGRTYVRCDECRLKDYENDNRIRVHDPVKSKEYEARPERKAKKAEWKKENIGKFNEYNERSRAKKIGTLGIDKYMEKQAVNAKNWRANNPDKVAENNVNAKFDADRKLYNYKLSADHRGIPWKLSDDEAKEMFVKPCYYCGDMNDQGINGIDRIDNTEYSIGNVVTSCAMCNMMKCTDTKGAYLSKIRRIASHMLMSNELYTRANDFKDYCSASFKNYRNRANKKRLGFSITEQQFNSITSNECYMCGKESTTTHHNGIDRINNRIGYHVYNCLPCCANCNYLKRDFELCDIMGKIGKTLHNLFGIVCHSTPNFKDNIANLFVEQYKTIINSKLGEEFDINHPVNKMDDGDGEAEEINGDSRNNEIDNTNRLNDNVKSTKELRKMRNARYERNKMNTLGKDRYNKIQALTRQIDRLKHKDPDRCEALKLEREELIKNENATIVRNVPKTKEQIREEARLRKQKQRQNKIDKYSNMKFEKTLSKDERAFRKNQVN